MSVEIRKHKEEELSQLVHECFTCEIDLRERREINQYTKQGEGFPSIEWYEDAFRKAKIRVDKFRECNAEYFI